MANPIFTNIEEYVNRNREQLLRKAVFATPSTSLFSVMTGVKYKEKINLLGTNLVYNDNACAFDPTSTFEFTDRELEVTPIVVNSEVCPEDMMKYWTNYQVVNDSGSETLGKFATDFTDGLIAQNSRSFEKLIYQGDTTLSDSLMNRFDGLIKIISAESTVTTVTGDLTDPYTTIENTILAIPTDADAFGRVEILVPPEFWKRYIFALIKANLYHYDPTRVETESMAHFGTNITVRSVEGLAGSNTIITAPLDTIIYGTDLSGSQDGADNVKFWYSDDNQVFRWVLKYRAGVQVALPEMIVLTTLS